MMYYLKKYWKVNLLTIFFQVLMYAFSACMRLILMREFRGVIQKNIRLFLLWTVAEIISWILYFICYGLHSFFRAKAIRAMNNEVRRDLTATLLKKDYLSYRAHDIGEYLSWLTGGVEQIESSAWDSFFSLTGCIAQIVAGLTALASLHWSLIIVSLLSSVLVIGAPKLFEKHMERLGKACAQAQASASSKLKDLLEGYNVLRAFNRNECFIKGVKESGEQIETPHFHKNCHQGWIFSGTGIINVMAQMFVTLSIAVLSIKGVIIETALLGGSGLCSDVANGLDQMCYQHLSFASAKPYFSRITVHANQVPHEASAKAELVREAIILKNVNFSYGEKPILGNLSLSFKRGGKYAITGPSGCGKSTLLKLLLGWLPDYSGTIQFDEEDIRHFNTEQIQQQMSYIEQNVFLFNTTIRDNITLGETFTDEQMEKALRDSALVGDIAFMPDGLDTLVGENGGNLSGGQKQRVAIARALIHNRSIILIDEGTSALDQKNAGIVEESLLANPELTLILVSHHLSPERKKQFDRVYDLQPVESSFKPA